MKHSWPGWNISHDLLRDSLLAVSVEFLVKIGRTFFKMNAAFFPSQKRQLKANKYTNKALN